MPTPEQQDLSLMRAMFSTVAPRYDFITRAFSYGMDKHWKKRGVDLARLPASAVVLDLASGTGDFSRLVCGRLPEARSVAVDLTENMLRLARGRGIREAVCADATRLPFPDGQFDCVFIGYGLRNFPNLKTALREVSRVTRPGGVLVTLDFFLPANPLMRPLYLGYLYAQGTFWGLVLHGRARIYTYIPDSLRHFVSIPEYEALLEAHGYRRRTASAYIFGGIGLHCAEKNGAARTSV
jgi:demethylmenaquinone methyltransferase/2-methoxy-6-polyprenyl-1,4-benzoquinol methylase